MPKKGGNKWNSRKPPAAKTTKISKTHIFTKDGIEYHIGDCALLKSNEELPFITKILGIRFDGKGQIFLECMWFFRPEDLSGGRQPWHGQNEVFLSNLTDDNPYESLMSKVKVHDLKLYKRESARDGVAEDVFFHRFEYDVKQRIPIDAGAERFCLCNQCENPDRLMVCCEFCKPLKWFHAGACGPARLPPLPVYTPQDLTDGRLFRLHGLR